MLPSHVVVLPRYYRCRYFCHFCHYCYYYYYCHSYSHSSPTLCPLLPSSCAHVGFALDLGVAGHVLSSHMPAATRL